VGDWENFRYRLGNGLQEEKKGSLGKHKGWLISSALTRMRQRRNLILRVLPITREWASAKKALYRFRGEQGGNLQAMKRSGKVNSQKPESKKGIATSSRNSFR